MSFLDVIPFTLFRRLATGAHARNAAVLEKIFEQFFDDFTSSPKKPEVLQVIRQVLDDPQYGADTDEDEISDGSDVAEHVIFNRLRDDGWLMEVKGRRATDVHMPREAHALLSALITLKEELRVDISAEASLAAEIVNGGKIGYCGKHLREHDADAGELLDKIEEQRKDEP